MKPSIGRIVIYNHPGSADGKYPPTQSPAIIQMGIIYITTSNTCEPEPVLAWLSSCRMRNGVFLSAERQHQHAYPRASPSSSASTTRLKRCVFCFIKRFVWSLDGVHFQPEASNRVVDSGQGVGLDCIASAPHRDISASKFMEARRTNFRKVRATSSLGAVCFKCVSALHNLIVSRKLDSVKR